VLIRVCVCMCVICCNINLKYAAVICLCICVHFAFLDKFAALWPFIGICAEVFILCAVIFLYERKQAKQLEKEVEKEEADLM